MSKNKDDGKTKKIRRGREDSGAKSQSHVMGETQDKGREHGTNPLLSGGEDRGGGNIDRYNTSDASSDIGKILERLHLLEERYIAYVKSHQGRLRARLDESEDDERSFLAESKALESDILEIAKKTEQTE